MLYGGVSLAIYIHGVSCEFFRAVHGRGVYRLIKALTDSDIVVDVVSGTSAGGINGIMLAFALCNGRDFHDVAKLWRESGDIRKLMRSPDAARPSSLLDSEGYYQAELRSAFEGMRPYQPEDGEDESPFHELDLFITGTDVHGVWSTEFDDAGHPIEVKDHRAVFHLKHRADPDRPDRPPRKRPFSPDAVTCEALAKLSRITSCFPGAFAPVHVPLGKPGNGSADEKLRLWGALQQEAFFLDGGVIDNKPFTYTLESIFSRVADRNVDRKLFYVDPDPEHSGASDRTSCPNILQTILASLVGIPGYESIADDLKLLEQRNRHLKQYKRMVRELEASWTGAVLALDDDGSSDESLKRAGITSTAQSAKLYERSRLVFLSERMIQGIFRGVNLQGEGVNLREHAAQLIRHFDDMEFDRAKLLRQIDVHFRRRRLYQLTYRIHDRLYRESNGGPSAAQTTTYRRLWETVNREIQLLDIIRWALETLVDEAGIDWQHKQTKEVWALAQCACYYLLDDTAAPAKAIAEHNPSLGEAETERWLDPDQLTRVYAAFTERIADVVEQIRLNTFQLDKAFASNSLLVQLDRCEKDMLKHLFPSDDPVCRAYLTFPALDELLFPLEMAGSLHEKDLIETVRISPRDAQRGFSLNSYSDKVSGDALYHFGAFFKRSWRSNDILWGRLDGACQLIESLLSEERLKEIVSNDVWRRAVRDRFFVKSGTDVAWVERLDPARLFPSAGARSHAALRAWITDLLSDHAWKEGLRRYGESIEILIQAAQLETIAADFPAIAGDAIEEQREWNQYHLAKKASKGTPVEAGSAPPWVFQPIDGHADAFITSIGSAERVHSFIASLPANPPAAASPMETALGKYFHERYRIGAEALTRDIPTSVLLEILASALLVTRNCILEVFGDQATRIRSSRAYVLCVTLPLRVFYWWAVGWRRAPATMRSFGWISVLCLLGLAIAYVFREGLFFSNVGTEFKLLAGACLVGIPLVVMGGQLMWLAHFAGKAK